MGHKSEESDIGEALLSKNSLDQFRTNVPSVAAGSRNCSPGHEMETLDGHFFWAEGSSAPPLGLFNDGENDPVGLIQHKDVDPTKATQALLSTSPRVSGMTDSPLSSSCDLFEEKRENSDGVMFGEFENHVLDTIGRPETIAVGYFAPSSGQPPSCFAALSSSSLASSESLWSTDMSGFPLLDMDPLQHCPSSITQETSYGLEQPGPLPEAGKNQFYQAQEIELVGEEYLGSLSQGNAGEESSVLEAPGTRRPAAHSFAGGAIELFQDSYGAQMPSESLSPSLEKCGVKEEGAVPSTWPWAGHANSKPPSLGEIMADLGGETENGVMHQRERLPAHSLGSEIFGGACCPVGDGQDGVSAVTDQATHLSGAVDRESFLYLNVDGQSRRPHLMPRIQRSIDKSNTQMPQSRGPQKPPTTAGIGLHHLKEVFHLHRPEAERHLRLKRTTFSNLSRYYGISKWPFRTLRDADKRIEHNAEMLRRPSTGRAKRRKLEVQQRYLRAVKELMYEEPHQSKDSNTLAVLLKMVAEREGSIQ